MLYWEPQECAAHDEMPGVYEATSHVSLQQQPVLPL